MKKLFTLFAAMFAVVALNAQTVDYYMMGFVDNSTDQNAITELNLSLNDDLNPNAVLVNNGPDVPAGTDTVYLDVAINGMDLGAMYIMGSQLSGLTAGQGTILSGNQALFTADQMNQAGIEGTFELCYTVRIVGAATDPDASNNQACLTINRGDVGVNEIAAGEISVYPNPATNVIYVANAEGAQVSVFDMNGRMVNSVESASANQAIDASSLAKGMYIVRIVDGQNVTTKKVNVVR